MTEPSPERRAELRGRLIDELSTLRHWHGITSTVEMLALLDALTEAERQRDVSDAALVACAYHDDQRGLRAFVRCSGCGAVGATPEDVTHHLPCDVEAARARQAARVPPSSLRAVENYPGYGPTHYSPCCDAMVTVRSFPDAYGGNATFICTQCNKALPDDYADGARVPPEGA